MAFGIIWGFLLQRQHREKQIFFIGNIIGFWLEVCFLSIYIGILLADQITRRRNIHVLSDRARSRLYNTLGFLFVGWAAHYLPFFLMNRQSFCIITYQHTWWLHCFLVDLLNSFAPTTQLDQMASLLGSTSTRLLLLLLLVLLLLSGSSSISDRLLMVMFT